MLWKHRTNNDDNQDGWNHNLKTININDHGNRKNDNLKTTQTTTTKILVWLKVPSYLVIKQHTKHYKFIELCQWKRLGKSKVVTIHWAWKLHRFIFCDKEWTEQDFVNPCRRKRSCKFKICYCLCVSKFAQIRVFGSDKGVTNISPICVNAWHRGNPKLLLFIEHESYNEFMLLFYRPQFTTTF